MSDLSFLKNAIQQQSTHQGAISNQSQTRVPDSTSLTLQELTRMAQSQKEAQQRSNPNWFNKSNKRSIPDHLVKRSSLKLNQNQSEEDDMDNYSTNASSQTNKKILSSFKKLQPIDQALHQPDFIKNNLDSELPPKKSIYDLNYDEDDINLSVDYAMKNTNDLIIKDPMNFKNAFNSNIRVGLTTNSGIASSKTASNAASDLNLKKNNYGTLFSKEEPISTSGKKSLFSTPTHHIPNQKQNQQQQPVESAVIIFGYDDNSFSEVLQHFSKFGTILEDFNISTNLESISSPGPLFSPRKKTYPIFIGKSWVKLTYDNPSSAIRACRENDLFIGDHPINIIPYSKEILEKLLNNKINGKDDIGDSLNNLNFINLHKVPGDFEILLQDTSIMDASKRENEMTSSSSIKIKNGESLFINPHKKTTGDEKTKKHPNILKKATDMLFGFDDV